MTDWQHKLVKTENISVETLLQMAHPENAREHPDHQLEATEELIETIGLIDEIKVSLHSGKVINGHARIQIALQSGQTSLPVNWYDLTEDEERLALEQYDATTYEATYNPDKLKALMEKTKGIKADKPALQSLMARLKERAGVSENGDGAKDAPDPQIDKAAQLQEKWGTRLGQVWSLGEHRLAVGDCTDKAAVEAMMRGEQADACITDPPYGMKWNADSSRFSGGKFGNHPRGREKEDVINDDKPFDPSPFLDYRVVVLWGFNHFCDRLLPGGVLVWIKKPDERFGTFLSDCELAWTNIGHGVYAFRHEWGGITRESERGEFLHPTQKPVKLFEWCIEKSKAGEIIYDPYVGSGTTLIACENLKRKCRAIELDPGYAGVAIQRWVDLAHQDPVLLSE